MKTFFGYLLQLDLKDVLAVWGAVLSSALGLLKIWEHWRDRHRIEIGYLFTSNASVGNTVTIRNLSNRPINIVHWELVAAADRKGKRDAIILATKEHGATDWLIGPYSFGELLFSDDRHFKMSDQFVRGKSVFITLYMAGGKTKTCMVRRVDT